MRTALVFGVTFVAGALFFACAKGDDAGTAGGDDTAGNADSGGDTSNDSNTSYVKDSGSTGDGATDDAAIDAGVDAAPSCFESGAACLTGSPGACSSGVLDCDGGVSTCVAISTTQSCYTGAVSTRNKGICHDGTQTCTGTLGACAGQTDPAAHENCFNDLDDDCDGLINNGCPTSIAIGGDDDLTARGGSGGGPASVHCPTGAFVTRVDSYLDGHDEKGSGVGIYCATPTLVQGASSYSVTLAANTPAPYQVQTGSTSNSVQRTDDCGLVGLTAIRYQVGNYDTYVESMGSHCGTSTVTLNADNSIALLFTDDTSTEYTGYSPFPGTFEEDKCPAGQVVVGFNMHHGAFMDQIQVVCAPLVVSYFAGVADP